MSAPSDQRESAGVTVALSVTEISHAVLVGAHRRIRSLGWASTDYVGAGLNAWGRDIEAACAEMAVAKALGVYYDLSEGRFCGDGDDVTGWQVRWTERTDGCLILRERDAPDLRYVLAVGLAPRFAVVGWAWGLEAKTDNRRRDPGGRGIPCWMVPQNELRPLGVSDESAAVMTTPRVTKILPANTTHGKKRP